jgi:hypothetical protein
MEGSYSCCAADVIDNRPPSDWWAPFPKVEAIVLIDRIGSKATILS